MNDRCIECFDYLIKIDEEAAKSIVKSFKISGKEKLYLQIYLRLVEEIREIMKISGARDIVVDAPVNIISFERLPYSIISRLINRPYLSAVVALLQDSQKRRIIALRSMAALLSEIWVISKIIDAVNGYTIGGSWMITKGGNTPFAYISSRRSGMDYTIFYQLNLYQTSSDQKGRYEKFRPFNTRNGLKTFLAIDIVVFKGKKYYVNFAEMERLATGGEKPSLLLEVKLGIPYIRNWRDVVQQMEDYLEIVRPYNIALASIGKASSTLKQKLKELGIEIFDNLLIEENQRRFKNYITTALGEINM
jgi:hypothetical protein